MIRIAHIVNPVNIGPTSDLAVAQPFVFEAMRIARDFAADCADVRPVAVCYPEDLPIVPAWMTHAAPLTRSVLDLQQFVQPRKFPLIGDILAAGRAAVPDADYYIYSNADIIVQPYTYRFIAERIAAGVDGIVINRRTVKAQIAQAGLSAIWAEVGKQHEGHDFFVFSRTMHDQFQLDETVIGVPMIGWIMNVNVALAARKYEIYATDADLTKHIGDDRAWGNAKRQDYVVHNRAATDRAFAALGVSRDDMMVHRAGNQRKLRRQSIWYRLRRQLGALRRRVVGKRMGT